MIGTKQEAIHWLLDAKGEQFEVKEYHPKRSLTANSYFHALQSQLASKLRTTPDELHKVLISRYSVVDTDLPPVTLRVDVPLERMPGYWQVGKISTNGKWKCLLKLKGSSEMNSAEFSRLLDGLIEECEEQGIPTITSTELARLRGYDARTDKSGSNSKGSEGEGLRS